MDSLALASATPRAVAHLTPPERVASLKSSRDGPTCRNAKYRGCEKGTGTFFYFKNTGSTTSPVFVLRTGAANPLNGEGMGFFDSAAALGDGDLDCVSGERFVTLRTHYLPEPGSGLMLAAGLAWLKRLAGLRRTR